ncbi:stage III sporulation protein AF [Desmospora profundinema]|uniref:Stage III sporulation protein AF n=1 Tax=Desmospora profundinema TaxID=1571184 RepID=A0ABU1IIR2_9BACL|nr:stage III sporulation protein AF [Desmospora profundinema]MDR6224657.1 stage III sporulation protein AF [Desmospora profundinema]
MIEWLSDWLKQIVILVLIATFLDLLLPNNALERYVKLVMGLLIILAMLVPIFDLFHADWDFTDFILDRAVQQESLDPIHKIKQDAKTLAGNREGLVREEVEQQLGESIGSEVSQRFKMEVTSITVQLETGDDGSVDGIKQVRITLQPATEKKEGSRQTRPVDEVSPVIVDLDKRGESPPLDRKQDGRSAEIASFVAEKWEMPVGRVHVTVEEGS